ncbi:lipoprotein-releasing system ATP-binding protein [Mariprofundus ferrinatatus]|uniref:Lipoprotein-releasing system ATP-binding protein n=1 Tax=Mariprofundus ferrinatatus TaxID=1921087 RepID=A0A2K8LC86_9PROT|nr:ABC transporter ATP-binding protein [Mariprofundus ferrinatatus]ATX81896.1 lipoprotein-releasing system ATP-binding protein [Mariprofundus ferrinatatus]
MSNALFEVTGLCKGFDAPAGRLEILKGLQFSLNEGEFLAVVGESGSGKSTMLQIIGTLERPDSGEIHLEGRSLIAMGEAAQAEVRNRKIGFVYQAHHLIPELTAVENVSLPLLVQGMTVADAEARAMQLLERLKLAGRAKHVPARLSGGEAQRVAVARALAARPRLILADEPTGNLDEHTAGEVFDLLQQLCREERAAVVMVTHSRALAKACDRMLMLHDGVLVPA